MKNKIILFVFIALIIMTAPVFTMAQEEDEDTMIKTAAQDIQIGKDWKLVPSITVPPLRLQESVRDNAKVDVVLTSSIGGGMSFAYVRTDVVTGEEERIFTWSPATILISGNTVEDMEKIDVSYAMTVGFFDDLIMAGFGYNFGDNTLSLESGDEVEISRWFFLMGLGVNFR